MARLIYSAITSLDGYVADAQGKFDWAEPDEEVHAFVNELERPTGTLLLGRRMYEVLSYWENPLRVPLAFARFDSEVGAAPNPSTWHPRSPASSPRV